MWTLYGAFSYWVNSFQNSDFLTLRRAFRVASTVYSKYFQVAYLDTCFLIQTYKVFLEKKLFVKWASRWLLVVNYWARGYSYLNKDFSLSPLPYLPSYPFPFSRQQKKKPNVLLICMHTCQKIEIKKNWESLQEQFIRS